MVHGMVERRPEERSAVPRSHVLLERSVPFVLDLEEGGMHDLVGHPEEEALVWALCGGPRCGDGAGEGGSSPGAGPEAMEGEGSQ